MDARIGIPSFPSYAWDFVIVIHEHEDSVLYISMGVVIVFGTTGMDAGCVIVGL